MPGRRESGHVKTVSDEATSAEDGAFAAQLAAVTIKGGDSDQGRDFSAIKLSQFRHLGQKQCGRARAHSTDRR